MTASCVAPAINLPLQRQRALVLRPHMRCGRGPAPALGAATAAPSPRPPGPLPCSHLDGQLRVVEKLEVHWLPARLNDGLREIHRTSAAERVVARDDRRKGAWGVWREGRRAGPAGSQAAKDSQVIAGARAPLARDAPAQSSAAFAVVVTVTSGPHFLVSLLLAPEREL